MSVSKELQRGLGETVSMYAKAMDAFKEGEGIGKVTSAAKVMHEETTLETKVAVPLVIVGAAASGIVLPIVGIGGGIAAYVGSKIKKYKENNPEYE